MRRILRLPLRQGFSVRLGVALVAVFVTFGLSVVHAQIIYAESQAPITDAITVGESLEVVPINTDNDQPFSFQTIALAQFVDNSVDCGKVACVAITFDDGPDPKTTPLVLDALERSHARATFFVVGNRVSSNVNLLRRMKSDGDEVGNHTWSHPDLTRLRPQQIEQQITLTQQAVVDAGLPAPIYFRPPYESRNNIVRSVVNMPFILWNVDTKDWQQKDPHVLTDAVLSQTTPGSIIILHDIKSVTANALPAILTGLQKKYKLVTVTDLLRLPQNARGEFRSR